MKKNISITLLVLLVLVSSASFYFYKKTVTLKTDPNAKAQEEAVSIVAQVGKLIILPEGETPTVATVSDPEKLKDQSFFAKAKVGDKVLLYQNAKRAYLYDPVANRVLEVAPINLGSANTSAQTPTPSSSKTTTTTKKK